MTTKSNHICIDVRMIQMSGIGRYISELLPFIIPQFEKVTLLGYNNELKSYTKYSNLSIINMTSSIYSIKEQLELKNKIPFCDIFWSPHYNTCILKTKAKKHITTIHDVYHLAFLKTLSLPKRVYAKLIINQAIKKSEKIITISNFSKEEILKYTNQKYSNKIEVIHNGFTPNSKPNNPHKENTFLYVGNIKPHKNLPITLKAFDLFLDNLSNTTNTFPKFKIIGKKEGFITGDTEIDSILNTNKRLQNQVVFTGAITDNQLFDEYSKALCLVFPSLYEGFGLPPLEAMSSGCPTVISNITSLTEVCEDASIYFNPYDINDISNKMELIYNSSTTREEYITKGYLQIKKYSWGKSATKHLAVIENIINHG